MAETAKKKAHTKKLFVLPDGSTARSARADATLLRFEAIATGETFEVDVSQLSDDMRTCAVWHGVSHKLGDVYADAARKGLVPLEEVANLWERIMGGEWVAEAKAGGGSPSLLVEAIIAVLTSKGRDITDELTESIREKCKVKENRDRYHGDKEIAAEYASIQAKRAAEKAKKAKAAAKGATDEGSALGDF